MKAFILMMIVSLSCNAISPAIKETTTTKKVTTKTTESKSVHPAFPLPIPFSNLIPAICIFFICAGLLECDLMLVIFGHTIAATIVWMIVASYGIIIENINSWWWF